MNNNEFIIGKLAENEFAKLFNNVSPSTRSEDMYEHWDLKITAKVDVKSLKKQHREDIMHNENFHWVEIKNVNDNDGWVYGDADFFAFETNDYWIILKKEHLQEFIENKTEGKKIGSSKDPYELYRRKDRKDVVVKVKTLDLFYIAHKIIKKDEISN